MTETQCRAKNANFVDMAAKAKAKLDAFAIKFTKDPSHTLTWSDSTFQDAARYSVFSTIAESPICGYEVQDAKNVLSQQIVGLSRNPAQSTSPTSNLMKQYELAAWTEALEAYDYL